MMTSTTIATDFDADGLGHPTVVSRKLVLKEGPYMPDFYCGYVDVLPGHPWHAKDYSQLEHVEVHGGITYAGPEEAGGFVVDGNLVEKQRTWRVGFDTAHGDNFSPQMAMRELDRLLNLAIAAAEVRP